MNIISVWLTPSEKDNLYLDKIIKNLGEKYDSCLFSPHLTIYAFVQNDKADLVIQAVQEATKDIKPFKIEVDKLNFTDYFFKTVFIEFKNNDFLTKINHILEKNLSAYSTKYEFKPHISLIYQKLSSKDKKAIIRSLKIKDSFTLTGAAVILSDDAESKEGIASWQVIYTHQF